jgi:chemotaxis protein methyltransferase CheR
MSAVASNAALSASPPPTSSIDFDYIRTLVRERSAIVLEPTKGYLAESRLLPLARKAGMSSLTELVAKLRGAPFGPLHRSVVDAMTTNETSFFRDLHPFDALRKNLIPELVQKRAATKKLVIWSAACSSGQEPYTIGMMLREYFPEILRTWQVQIVATDLSNNILTRARRGAYSQLEVNRGLPAALMIKYFQKDGIEWAVKDDVKRMVEFREINLASAWPALPQPDIVFLRNVLIYFDIETKRDILGRARKLMRPDGFLFLGAAETTLSLDENFERMQFDKAGCYRIKSAA